MQLLTLFFSNNAINNLTLYPRQTVFVQFCLTINPFCDGRPNPTPSGSGIDFDHTLNVTSTSAGNDTTNLLLTDFHTSAAILAAGLYIPNTSPTANSDGTYNYTNTVTITNEGTATANNINYNMGLGNFLSNGIIYNQLEVTQTSGPSITVNSSFNGNDSSLLLDPNNSLDAGENYHFRN